jgi:hypothetical protein
MKPDYEIEEDEHPIVQHFKGEITEELLESFRVAKTEFEAAKAIYEAKRDELIRRADGKTKVEAGKLMVTFAKLAPRFPWKAWAVDKIGDPTPQDITEYLKKPKDGDEPSYRVDVGLRE